MSETIRRNIIWGSAVVLVSAAAIAYTYARGDSASTADRVARGKYLVNAAGCHDCHTPWKPGPNGPEPDMTRMLSGHPETEAVATGAPLRDPWVWAAASTNTAFSGPWGISYAFNLTPDRNTGLGIWTEDMFVTAIKTGRHMGTSRPINPPMPWPSYRNFDEEDLRAIYAYLRTVPPIVNHVPDYVAPATPTEAR